MSWRNVDFLALTGKIGKAQGMAEVLIGDGVEVLFVRAADGYQKCQWPVE